MKAVDDDSLPGNPRGGQGACTRGSRVLWWEGVRRHHVPHEIDPEMDGPGLDGTAEEDMLGCDPLNGGGKVMASRSAGTHYTVMLRFYRRR